MLLPVLPLAEGGAVVDLMAARALTHRHAPAVHTHLIDDDLSDVRAPLGIRIVLLLKRDLILKRLSETKLLPAALTFDPGAL